MQSIGSFWGNIRNMRLLPYPTYLNLFHQFRRIRAGERRPIFCSWFITGECPIRCNGCIFYERHPRIEGELPLAKKELILKRLASARLPFLFIAGGEPLLSKDVFRLGMDAKRFGLYPVLITNGMMIEKKEMAAEIAKSFKSVVFSIDGLKEGHEKTRGEKTYDKVIQGLKNVLSVKGRPPVYVNCVLNKFNMDDIPGFILAMRDLGVDKVNMQPNCLPQHRPDRGKANGKIDALIEMKIRYPGFIAGDMDFIEKMRRYILGEEESSCSADSLAQIAILPDGTVSACCEYFVSLGNILDESLDEILERKSPDLRPRLSSCPGCCRKDYDLVHRFFEKPIWTWRIKDLKMLASL